ncbi:MAG: hypothetical protein ARM1_0519 [Candidatus Micrarchaeota archaeon]|nr:MAG: hypothetical protein ARM1_0519 [Candidatus Micrarchaeota archaeon]
MKNTSRPITKNLKDIINDIDKLRAANEFSRRSILFFIFPCNRENEAKNLAKLDNWKIIKEKVKDKDRGEIEVKFNDTNIHGILSI